jgi:hypothetical protein
MLVPVLINGMSPYIGLKTQGTFSMFSNLRTEGSSNHLFLERIDLFRYQSDIVLISRSSHLRLARFADQPMTYFNFRQNTSAIQGDVIVEFVRNGQSHLIRKRDAEGEYAEIFEPYSWWISKFLAFRRLPNPEKPMPCMW